jgi:sugar lactone lactonase YvrE
MALADAAAAAPLRDRIPLPRGFFPEGIASDVRDNLYVGSIATGAIFRIDADTGRGRILLRPPQGRPAIGLSLRHHKLYVAGGETGQAYVYNTKTGRSLASIQLADGPSFINDVVATRRAAWFTDSFNPVLYRVPVRRNGAPGNLAHVRTIPLKGVRYAPGFNVNGIDATPHATKLVIVQSNTGLLFSVDPGTGKATRIDLGGERVTNGDGLLLDGRRMFVVQGFDNRIAIVRLSRGLQSGNVVRRITDDDFDVPTTVAEKGERLYVVNARFTTPVTPQTRYWVAVIRKP